MKKNTLIKILCLALVCVLVLPMVVACSGGAPAQMWTVTLDPNGGVLPEDAVDEFEVADEEKIGRLPTPTRLGYKFLGWYDIEDKSMSEEITRKFEVDDDYDLIAHWEAEGKVITVEFNPASGTLDREMLNGKTYIDMIAGNKLADFIEDFPAVTREGYEFVNWKIGSLTGKTCALTEIFDDSVVLYATWQAIPTCSDGSYIHDWGVWKDATDATCTTAGQRVQACSICGQNKSMDDPLKPALGHKYPNGGAYETVVYNNVINGSRTCSVCGDEELHAYEQITYKACDAQLSGQWYTGGIYSASSNIDGAIVPNVATKNLGQCSITVSVKNDATYNGKVYIDALLISGQGSAVYEVHVTYADGTRELLTNGTFSRANEVYGGLDIYTIGTEVRSVELVIPNPSDGQDKPCEIGFLLESK